MNDENGVSSRFGARRRLTYEERLAAFVALGDFIDTQNDAAKLAMSRLRPRDPETWLGELIASPSTCTAAMMRALASAAVEPGASQHDPLQLIAVAESLGDAIGEDADKAQALTELSIARARVLRSRGDLTGALAALERALTYARELDWAEIYEWKAKVYGAMGDYDSGLTMLLQSYRFCLDGGDSVRALFAEFITAIKGSP